MGGYSAGYYSYIWSEVLDADTVEWFKENGGLRRENGDHFRRSFGLVHKTPDPQTALKPKRNFSLHVGQFALEQLCLGQRFVELLAIQPILTRSVPAEFRCSERAPGNTISCAVQTTEGALQTFHIR